MYGWIWRHLPFGVPGKIVGSLVLLAAAFALLWYYVFPAVEPLLPIDEGQVSESGNSGQAPGNLGRVPGPGDASGQATGDPGGRVPDPILSAAVGANPARPATAQQVIA